MLVVEMSAGQLLDDVTRMTKNQCPIQFYGRAGGTVPLPEDVLKQIELMVNEGIPADVDPKDLWFERLTAELGLTYES